MIQFIETYFYLYRKIEGGNKWNRVVFLIHFLKWKSLREWISNISRDNIEQYALEMPHHNKRQK